MSPLACRPVRLEVKTAYCVALGCSENTLDGLLIRHYLQTNDWTLVDRAEDADLIILNSCGVTEDNERLAIDTYRHLASVKRPESRLIFAGCLPAINRQAIRETGYNDVFVTPRTLHLLDAITEARTSIDASRSGCIAYSTDHVGPSFDTGRRSQLIILRKWIAALKAVPVVPIPRWLWQILCLPDHDVEFVRISVGCSSHCSFCSIPRAKGATTSVAQDIVVEQVSDAIRHGKERIALSCDELGSYGQDLGTDIVSLLDELTTIPGRFTLSLRNVHPAWMMRYWSHLRDVFRRGKISYAVIPLQSGSDAVLELMEREHTAAQYRQLIDEIRSVSPRTILRTMMITGFPGETDREFQTSCRFLEMLPVDSFCAVPYSERRSTPSRNLPGKVPRATALQRAKIMRRINCTNVFRSYRWLPLRP